MNSLVWLDHSESEAFKYHWPISELLHFRSRLVQPITLFTVDSWFSTNHKTLTYVLHSVYCSANQWAITLFYTVKKNMSQLYCTHCWTVNNNCMIRPLYSTGLLETPYIPHYYSSVSFHQLSITVIFSESQHMTSHSADSCSSSYWAKGDNQPWVDIYVESSRFNSSVSVNIPVSQFMQNLILMSHMYTIMFSRNWTIKKRFAKGFHCHYIKLTHTHTHTQPNYQDKEYWVTEQKMPVSHKIIIIGMMRTSPNTLRIRKLHWILKLNHVLH